MYFVQTYRKTVYYKVSNVNDLIELKKIGCTGVIIGKAIYEGKITMNELKQFIS
jgi:phosphoribosylformimino-5-aminoimidazole carboxamide ribotide isomerase